MSFKLDNTVPVNNYNGSNIFESWSGTSWRILMTLVQCTNALIKLRKQKLIKIQAIFYSLLFTKENLNRYRTTSKKAPDHISESLETIFWDKNI